MSRRFAMAAIAALATVSLCRFQDALADRQTLNVAKQTKEKKPSNPAIPDNR